MKSSIEPIIFKDNKLLLLDQRRLPIEENYIECLTLENGHDAIKDMVVRGAPCIGFTALYSLVLWLQDNKNSTIDDLSKACNYLSSARPTAVNLKYEVDRMFSILKKTPPSDWTQISLKIASETLEESHRINTKMGSLAVKEIQERFSGRKVRALTHCNTGTLACGSLGTALGAIELLQNENLLEHVWASETRPYLQGSRLTAYELLKNDIAHSIIVEGAVSHLMQNNLVDVIFVGADRIVANGDTANKIGTSNLSILANYYGVPMFVLAPSSSFDMSMSAGDEIEIELREEDEIKKYKNLQISPLKSSAYNPSFDITKGELITGIINENGISYAKDDHVNLKGLVQ